MVPKKIFVVATRRRRNIKMQLRLLDPRAQKFNTVINNHGRKQKCDFFFLDRKHPQIKIVNLCYSVPKQTRIGQIQW